MSIQRNAQAFYLSSTLQTANPAAAAFTLTATSALDLLLDSLYINFGSLQVDDRGTALVTAMSISGQSIFASNQGMPFSAFLPSNNYAVEGINSLSLTIATNQVFSVTMQAGAAGFAAAPSPTNPIGFAISTEPTDIVVSPNDSGELLNYCFGMGSVNVPAGGNATLQATCLRDNVFLGRLIMDTDSLRAPGAIPREALQITSILVDGIELLSAQTPQATPLLLSQLTPDSNDKTGLQANYFVKQNSQVLITVQNTDGANAHNVCGGFYCKPIPA